MPSGPWIPCGPCSSLPARGAWIEIVYSLHLELPALGRSPHGERGLKSKGAKGDTGAKGSLPARGAWIEMKIKGQHTPPRYSRSPHGERGLKSFDLYSNPVRASGRSPHGERGLKFQKPTPPLYKICPSLPARGAWIEIPMPSKEGFYYTVAPRTGSVD